MTHEQKPERAEFRTREAQIDGQIEDIFEAHEAEDSERVISKGDLRLMIEAAHKSAEARGAAEQRRKDAERAEAVYLIQHPDGGWDEYTKQYWESAKYPPEEMRVLYTRPANVAALEARVKELEAVVRGYLEASDLFDACTMICPPRALFEAKDMAMHHLRAAAIREGGE